jgi:CheY-like chemotaxis protein
MSKGKILWVEDDIELIAPLVRPLIDSGFEIVGCRNLGEALARIKEIQTFDLILLDLILPEIGQHEESDFAGLQFLRRLRSEFDVQMPVIVLSVVANKPEIAKSLKELNAIPLGKPIRPTELRNVVFEIFGSQTS